MLCWVVTNWMVNAVVRCRQEGAAVAARVMEAVAYANQVPILRPVSAKRVGYSSLRSRSWRSRGT
jgi:hypothetical protein